MKTETGRDSALPLFDRYPSAPGWKVKDTSREAAEAIKPKASTLRDKVFTALKLRPMSADEVAAEIGEPWYSVRPRCSELEKLGLIEDSGEKTLNPRTNKRAVVWRIKQ